MLQVFVFLLPIFLPDSLDLLNPVLTMLSLCFDDMDPVLRAFGIQHTVTEFLFNFH